MLHIIEHTLIDTLKLLPFLFVTFFVMEYIEHKTSKKSKEKIEKAGKFGPLVGSLLGSFPQCGFSVAATNLYATRIISIGTLVAIYLATSDEMLPILLSEQVEISLIVKVLSIKIVIGIIFGFLIDIIFFKKEKETIKDFCEEEHCDCEHGIVKSSIKHTLHIYGFIVLIELILNIIMHYMGQEMLQSIFMKDSIFGPFITSLVGLIPNCAASVAITELYLNEAITFGAFMSGLLTGSGVAILVLFKTNKNIKENIKITSIVYFIGVVCGILFDLIGVIL